MLVEVPDGEQSEHEEDDHCRQHDDGQREGVVGVPDEADPAEPEDAESEQVPVPEGEHHEQSDEGDDDIHEVPYLGILIGSMLLALRVNLRM